MVAGHDDVTHFGRHRSKLELVEGTTRELVTDDTAAKFAQVNMSDALLTVSVFDHQECIGQLGLL